MYFLTLLGVWAQEFAATYSTLDDDVSDSSITKGDPRGRTVGIPNLRKDNTLIEVDAIVSNITRQKHQKSVWTKPPKGP